MKDVAEQSDFVTCVNLNGYRQISLDDASRGGRELTDRSRDLPRDDNARSERDERGNERVQIEPALDRAELRQVDVRAEVHVEHRDGPPGCVANRREGGDPGPAGALVDP